MFGGGLKGKMFEKAMGHALNAVGGGSSSGHQQGMRFNLVYSCHFDKNPCFFMFQYRVTHQVRDYILLTLIWELHHVAYMACQYSARVAAAQAE